MASSARRGVEAKSRRSVAEVMRKECWIMGMPREIERVSWGQARRVNEGSGRRGIVGEKAEEGDGFFGGFDVNFVLIRGEIADAFAVFDVVFFLVGIDEGDVGRLREGF